jgi:hypothetical protein
MKVVRYTEEQINTAKKIAAQMTASNPQIQRIKIKEHLSKVLGRDVNWPMLYKFLPESSYVRPHAPQKKVSVRQICGQIKKLSMEDVMEIKKHVDDRVTHLKKNADQTVRKMEAELQSLIKKEAALRQLLAAHK